MKKTQNLKRHYPKCDKDTKLVTQRAQRSEYTKTGQEKPYVAGYQPLGKAEVREHQRMGFLKIVKIIYYIKLYSKTFSY